MKKLVYFLLILSATVGNSANRFSESFTLDIYDNYIRVVAPNNYEQQQSIVINNRTMVRVKGVVKTQAGDVLAYVSIPRDQFQVVQVHVSRRDKIYFVPMSPGLPEAELIVGRKSYEVPPQK